MKVAGYVRVSTKKQNIDPQIEELKKWADYHDHEIEIYSDDGVSAIDEREGYQKAINSIINGDNEAIVVTALDRFGRSVNQLSREMARLEKKDKDLIILEQNIDTSTKTGKFLFNILSAVAELEREIIRERLMSGKRRSGNFGGRPKKDFDEEEMIDMYEKGASYQFLANHYDVSASTIYNRLIEAGAIEKEY